MLGVSSVLKCSCLLLSCSQAMPPEEIQLPQSPARTCRLVPTAACGPAESGRRKGDALSSGTAGDPPHLRLLVPGASPKSRQSCQPRWGCGSGKPPRFRASGDRPARPWHPASRRAPLQPRWCSLAAVAAAEGTASPRPRPGPAPLSSSLLLSPNRLVPATCPAASF